MQFLANNRRKILLCFIDLAIYLAVYAFSVLGTVFVTDMTFSDVVITQLIFNFLIFAATIMLARISLRVYSNVWRYVNCRAYLEMLFADVLAGCVALAVTHAIGEAAYVSGWQTIGTLAAFCLLSLSARFLYQEIYRHSSKGEVRGEGEKRRIAIIGAGMIGSLLAEELLCYKGSQFLPIFFIDNDKSKVGNRVSGLPVFEDGDSALSKLKLHGITDIIVTISKLDLDSARRIFEFYGQAGYNIKIYDFPGRNPKGEEKRVIREFKIEDLLFRSAKKLLDEQTEEFYRGKTILVTGGGGSIGSELCRQIAKCNPKRLVIFDIYENNAYDIQQELVREYGSSLDLAVEIGSVRDRARLDEVFARHTPQILFRAAAHKHVPLMEHSSAEAVKNNVLGTYNTADMAEKYGVEKFILISTDKAVNPTNVMGASKRMCEMVIRCRNDSNTAFSAVRFGNVLGSNGSVIPLFRRQIAEGGPITITDKRIIRYFMTIPEASGLVMQAGAMAKRGELFVLDMGKPVKIIDLAINMIRFSGLEPYRDIMIEEIGLRPGEKLYEELLVKRENMQKTENDLVFIEHEEPLTRAEVEEKLSLLRRAVEERADISAALKAVVPTFRAPDEINKTAEDAEEMKEAGEPLTV